MERGEGNKMVCCTRERDIEVYVADSGEKEAIKQRNREISDKELKTVNSDRGNRQVDMNETDQSTRPSKVSSTLSHRIEYIFISGHDGACKECQTYWCLCMLTDKKKSID